jgi:hypothetical protein
MKRLILAVFVILIAIFIGIWITRPKTAPVNPGAPTPTSYSLPTLKTWQDIAPGVTTIQEVVTKLGSPTLTQEGDTQILSYPTTNKHWKNEVFAKNNRVIFIRERLFAPAETSYQKLISGLVEQSTQLYGPDFEGGMFLFVYPKTGVAFLVNTSHGVVYERWYFPPTSLQDFLLLPQAKDYGFKPKPETEGI